MELALRVIGLACVGYALACGDGSADGTPMPAGAGGGAAPQGCDARSEVFAVVCGTSVCHDGAINGLDLLSPDVDARLLNVPAAGINCRASGLKLVDSQQPDRSLLLLKLSDMPPCGSPMPLGSGPSGLTQAQRTCIEDFAHELADR